QGVRELVLNGACYPLPMLGVCEPVRAIGGKRPGSDVSDAIRQRVDVAIRAVCLLDLASEPVRWNGPLPCQETIQRDHKLRMSGGGNITIIPNMTDIPKPRAQFSVVGERHPV